MQQINAIREAEARLVQNCNHASEALEAVSTSAVVDAALDRLQRAATAAQDRLRAGNRMALAIIRACTAEVSLLAFDDEQPLLLPINRGEVIDLGMPAVETPSEPACPPEYAEGEVDLREPATLPLTVTSAANGPIEPQRDGKPRPGPGPRPRPRRKP